MISSRRYRMVVVGPLIAALVGCSPGSVSGPDRTDPGLSATWREQAGVRTADLLYPGTAYPVVVGPIDPEPALYADAVRVLAASGELPAAERDRAVALLAQWWPARDEDGFRWLSLIRALRTLDAMDRVSADRLAPMIAWIRSTLKSPDTSAGRARRVIAAAQLASELLRAAPDDPTVVDLPALLDRAATRVPCASAATVQGAVAPAVLAAAADQPCRVPTTVGVAARDQLRQPGDPDQLNDQITRMAELSPLAAVGLLDRAAFLHEARDILSRLGHRRYDRGGDTGQAMVVTVVDMITVVDTGYTLPPVQVQNLRRIVRSESRLPDAADGGEPLDTAIAVDTLRRLGQPAPGPVNWNTTFTLLDRTVLALALDRDRLPTPEQARTALDGQPPATMTLGYLAAAYPGLCLPQMRDLRRTMEATTDLAQWPSDRLFQVALFVSATATCGGADQQRLVGALTQALDGLRAGSPATGPAGTAQPAATNQPNSPSIVDTWYLAEAGCLLGQPTRYLPAAAALREAVAREVGIDRIRPETTIRHLYAALRLTELVGAPDACGSTWWQAGSRR